MTSIKNENEVMEVMQSSGNRCPSARTSCRTSRLRFSTGSAGFCVPVSTPRSILRQVPTEGVPLSAEPPITGSTGGFASRFLPSAWTRAYWAAPLRGGATGGNCDHAVVDPVPGVDLASEHDAELAPVAVLGARPERQPVDLSSREVEVGGGGGSRAEGVSPDLTSAAQAAPSASAAA